MGTFSRHRRSRQNTHEHECRPKDGKARRPEEEVNSSLQATLKLHQEQHLKIADKSPATFVARAIPSILRPKNNAAQSKKSITPPLSALQKSPPPSALQKAPPPSSLQKAPPQSALQKAMVEFAEEELTAFLNFLQGRKAATTVTPDNSARTHSNSATAATAAATAAEDGTAVLQLILLSLIMTTHYILDVVICCIAIANTRRSCEVSRV
jgi:hypothetical protein